MITKENKLKEELYCLYTGEYHVDIVFDGNNKRITIYDQKKVLVLEYIEYYYDKQKKFQWFPNYRIFHIFYQIYKMSGQDIGIFIHKMLTS